MAASCIGGEIVGGISVMAHAGEKHQSQPSAAMTMCGMASKAC